MEAERSRADTKIISFYQNINETRLKAHRVKHAFSENINTLNLKSNGYVLYLFFKFKTSTFINYFIKSSLTNNKILIKIYDYKNK